MPGTTLSHERPSSATCLLAAGCSQSPDELAGELQANEIAEATAEDPDADEAAGEVDSEPSLTPVDQFEFETAIGGIARIEAELCDGDSVGTGFMIDERHIVTVAHVIEGATSILVEVNGDLAEAVIVGFDKERDIALLRSDIPLGDQTFELQDIDYTTGDEVSAIGFPRGLDASLTTGVISNQEVEFDSMPFSRFIQVDAPLNPGNSGGPVFNEAGDVIGIVDWGLSESQGLNFAIAISSVDRIIGEWVGNAQVSSGDCASLVDGGGSEGATAVATLPAAQRVTADHFSFELPNGYIVVDLDKDVGYGLRTRLEGPATPLSISRTHRGRWFRLRGRIRDRRQCRVASQAGPRASPRTEPRPCTSGSFPQQGIPESTSSSGSESVASPSWEVAPKTSRALRRPLGRFSPQSR